MRTIVLASASPYRKRLLDRLGVAFTTDAADIDETPRDGEDPVALVGRLSRAKAAAVAARHPTSLIIASDQCGELGGRLLNKPGDRARARAQLRAASGSTARFLTGLCVLDASSGAERFALDSCSVTFRQLSEATIEDYLEREQPFDCAGSFKVEGLGIALFSRLDVPDPSALEGLPLIRLVDFLGELGAPVLRP
jgi:septum formation protein